MSWERNWEEDVPGTCPANVLAWPTNVCGPAIVPFPPLDANRWTDWPGRWGETKSGFVGPTDADSPCSPAGLCGADHYQFYVSPWGSSAVSCPQDPVDQYNNPLPSGTACPSRANQRPVPLMCANWFGGAVVALGCDQPAMRSALQRRQLSRQGRFTVVVPGDKSRAATAPGLAQLLGSSLHVGGRVAVRGTVLRGTILLLRVAGERKLFVLALRAKRSFRGTAVVRISRTRGGVPAIGPLNKRSGFQLVGRMRERAPQG